MLTAFQIGGALLLILAILTFAAIAWWAVRAILDLREDRQKAIADLDSLDILASVPDELVTDQDVFRFSLAQGEVRQAIISCWAHLEDATAKAGVPITPSETSSEYTERVMSTWVTEGSALSDLAALYREARFSTHDLGEEQRAAAQNSLERLLSDLHATWKATRHVPA